MVAVDIANLALAYLGDSATVASIDPPEGSPQAQHCARFYPMALNMMLEAHNWNFTTVRQALALVQENYFQWRYAYACPADLNTLLSVLPQTYYTTTSGGFLQEFWQRYPLEFELLRSQDFKLEMIGGQQCILTHEKQAVARYTRNTVQPGQFPALFTDALAWKLASMVAGPLIKGEEGATMSKNCLIMSERQLSAAKMQDANQELDSSEPIPSGIEARF